MLFKKQLSDDWGQLMAKAQDGDSAAYQKLLAAIQPALLAFARKQIFDAQLAEDASQEIMLAIHKQRHTFDPTQPFKPWMYAIARHKCIDTIRKIQRKSDAEVGITDEIETFLTSSSNTEDEDVKKDLETALSSLNEKQQKVIHLMKLEGYTAQEVADQMDMTVSAVKVTAHRAIKHMQKSLGSK